jgi:uncharacterized membrane protein
VVDVCNTSSGADWQFVLRPNRSISWRGSLLFFGSLVLISTAIALAFAAQGLWMVLPFAGLEMAALGAALYLVSRHCHQCEVINVGASEIAIERGYGRPSVRRALPRTWSRVELLRPTGPWQPTRLLIRAPGGVEEVGSFLNESERAQLAENLCEALRC